MADGGQGGSPQIRLAPDVESSAPHRHHASVLHAFQKKSRRGIATPKAELDLVRREKRRRAVVVGDGRNRKSMAHIENVAGALVHALTFGPDVHVFDCADKPDLDMDEPREIGH